MKQDMQDCQWFKDKVRGSTNYAQNLYAAMCNMQWQKLETWPILTNEYWTASWRASGGIVATLRGEGDYLDWYCSGIFNEGTYIEHYVEEGTVTDEIQTDLELLGWKPVPYIK
jgi:hypothetical protein